MTKMKDFSLRSFAVSFLLIISLAALGLVFSTLAVISTNSNRIVQGVNVAGYDIGNLDFNTANTKIKHSLKIDTRNTYFKLRLNDSLWEISLERIDAHLDLEMALLKAKNIGRRGTAFQQFRERYIVEKHGRTIKPTLTYNEAKLIQILKQIATQVSYSSQPAMFTIKDGRPIYMPKQAGRKLDINVNLQEIKQNLSSFNGAEIVLRVKKILPK